MVMSFHDVGEVEEALRTPRLSVRALHEIWEQRLPVPEPVPRKPTKLGGDGRLIAWIQEDLRLAAHFCRQSFENEDFQLVCDAAREILRYWEQEGKTGSREFASTRMDFAAARENTEGRRFATLRARAEALALLGKEDEAAAAYQALITAEDCSISALAEARYRTRFIADALQRPRDFLKAAFPPLQLI